MRATITTEDALYQQAFEVADPGMDKAELFREAIRTFVRVQASKRLAALGGKRPMWPTYRAAQNHRKRHDCCGQRAGRYQRMDRSLPSR